MNRKAIIQIATIAILLITAEFLEKRLKDREYRHLGRGGL